VSDPAANEEAAHAFYDELRYMLAKQMVVGRGRGDDLTLLGIEVEVALSRTVDAVGPVQTGYWAWKGGYFINSVSDPAANEEAAHAFYDELRYMLRTLVGRGRGDDLTLLGIEVEVALSRTVDAVGPTTAASWTCGPVKRGCSSTAQGRALTSRTCGAPTSSR
jgi:hypothetical protein